MKWQSDLPCWKRERTTCWRPKGNTIQWIVNFTIVLRSPALKMAGKSSADPVQLTRNMTACLIKDIWDFMQHIYRVEGKYLQQQTFVKVIKTLVLVTCWAATAEEIGWAVHLSEGWWFDPHLLQSTYRVSLAGSWTPNCPWCIHWFVYCMMWVEQYFKRKAST